MTPTELRAECARVRDRGLTFVSLVIPYRREPRGLRVRVLPGVLGEIGNVNPHARTILAFVRVADLDRFLDRAGVPR